MVKRITQIGIEENKMNKRTLKELYKIVQELELLKSRIEKQTSYDNKYELQVIIEKLEYSINN